MDDDALDAFGDHTAVHDEAWEAARREMQMTMKARKGGAQAVPVGGDLQRQSFNSDHRGHAVFCTSTRSRDHAASLSGILAKKGTRKELGHDPAASRATATEANAAGGPSTWLCRTANQAEKRSSSASPWSPTTISEAGAGVSVVSHRMATGRAKPWGSEI